MTQKEKLIELIAKKPQPYTYEQLAGYLLANGVVIPVRCEECTHGENDGTGIQCRKYNKQFSNYDFCSYGERRSSNK